MLKKSLLVVAAVAMLAGSAQAGAIKFHDWPCTFTPQEVVTIPVVMDIGYWIKVKNQDAKIKLNQVNINLYEGCTDIEILTNVDIALSCSVKPNGAVPGDWSCSVSPSEVDASGGTVSLCAKVEKPDLSGTPGGKNNVQVATVSLKVVPRVGS